MAYQFNVLDTHLPVAEIVPEVRKRLVASNTLLVTAAPGAGKSTVLPLSLLDEPWLGSQKIIVLEPRRLAASSIAYRMSDLLKEAPGETVGYRIRFENKVSNRTRIEVVTEGILTRMLQSDSTLEGIGLIVFDEFHERSMHADLALALSREVQEVLRPDLRILVMSATLNVPQLADLLQAPVVESRGMMHPVEVFYTPEQAIEDMAEACAQAIRRAVREKEGDLLAFLPGRAEIVDCTALLKKLPGDFSIHQLYGQLSHSEQQAALLPDRNGRRKIVLATSIAETSLTIEGVRIVVDSGYTRKSVFDPGTGLSGLKTVRISADAAEQRTGRAGRLGPGTCYRLWSMATQQRLAEFRIPEILESDLSALVLDLLAWGISDFRTLQWLSIPPETSLNMAKDTLLSIGAMEGNRITEHGKVIRAIPCHPRLANMLIKAKEMGSLALATDIAALLEERDPMERLSVGADLNLRIEALRRHRSGDRYERSWEKVEKTASAYRRMFKISADNADFDPYLTGLLIAYAFPERIASLKNPDSGTFLLSNGKLAAAGGENSLSHENWISVAHLDMRKGSGKIFLAAPLNPNDVVPLAREEENLRWDSKKGLFLATTELKIGGIVLQSKPVSHPDKEKLNELVSELLENEGERLLDFNQEVEQLQNRINSLRSWNPEQVWPDLSTANLLKQNKLWFGPYFSQLRRSEDFRKINLAQVLVHALEYEQQLALNTLAPSTIAVPSGSQIKLSYSPYGDEPVLAVRLQEIFGLLETPRVNGGKKPVIIHLLSPGFKPVQVTSDLRSFWENTYFEVRKELKRRYPKHSWPENPLEAEAIRGPRRRTS